MDNLEEVSKTVTKNTFIQHVFEFDDATKNELLNIGQYSVLVLVPVVALNKLMKYYIPEAEETKGSIELGFEIVGQVILLFIGLFYIHRIATFLPTYSGQEYEQFNVHSIILVALLIVSSLHTKLGEKASILTERVIALWNGEESLNMSQQNKKMKKTSQPPVQSIQPNVHMPLAQSQPQPQGMPPQQINTVQQVALGGSEQQYAMPQQAPVEAPEFMQNEIMAANEGVGSAFGSMF